MASWLLGEYDLKIKEKVWRWERYKVFFQITIFKYFVLWFSVVPFLAVLLAQMPEQIDLNIGGKVIPIKPELPFSWQLLWLSSLFFVVALIIYFFACPEFIKKYNNYGEYLTYHHDYRWMSWEACELLKHKIDRDKFTSRLLTKKFAKEIDSDAMEKMFDANTLKKPIVNEKTTDFYYENKGKFYKLSFPKYTKESNEYVIDPYADKGMFFEIFGRYSASKTFARAIIFILLSISFVLFFIVLVQHIFHGAIFFLEWVKDLYAWGQVKEIWLHLIHIVTS